MLEVIRDIQALPHGLAGHDRFGVTQRRQQVTYGPQCQPHAVSHSELAEQPKLPLGTVKTWVRRGLDQSMHLIKNLKLLDRLTSSNAMDT